MKSHYFWSALRLWTQRLGSVITFVVLARILSPAELGLFSAALAIVTVVELVNENGVGEAVVQARGLTDGMVRTMSTINLSIACVACMTMIFGAQQIEIWFATPGLSKIMPVMAIPLAINAFNYVPQALLRRDLDYRWLAMRGLSALIIGTIVGISLALLGFGVWSMVAQLIAVSVSNFVILRMRRGFRFRPSLNFTEARPLINFSMFVFLGNILNYTSSRAIELAITYHFGATELAHYVIGSRFYFVASQMISAVILDVGFAHFSRVQDDDAAFEKGFLTTLLTASFVTSAVFFGLVATAKEACEFLFAEKGTLAYPYLMATACFGPIVIINFLTSSALKAKGRSRLVSLVMAVQAALSLLIFIPDWGLTTLQMVLLANIVIVTALPVQIFALSRISTIRLTKVASLVAPPILIGIGMIGVIMAVKPTIDALGLVTLLRLPIVVLTGVLFFCPFAYPFYILSRRRLASR